jgi:hypothetical protein
VIVDLLLLVLWTALGLVVGAALGYLLGVGKERHKTHNTQQIRAISEIREKVRKLQRDFLEWSAPPERRLDENQPSRFEQSWRIVGELDTLRASYEAHKPWLKPTTHQIVESICEGFEQRILALAKVLWANNADPRSPYNEDEAATSVHEWARDDIPSGLPALKRRFDEESKRSTGDSPGWRRRLFGGDAPRIRRRT